MTSRQIVVLGTAIAASAVLYQQHTRLARLYPHTSAPPLTKFTTLLSPACQPYTSEHWGQPTLGHTWTLDVPLFSLRPSSRQNGEKAQGIHGQLVESFARAYWSSSPLKIEGFVIGTLARMGLIRSFSPRLEINQDERQFGKGSTVVNGAFVVENDLPLSPLPPSSSTENVNQDVLSGPLISRWGDVSSAPGSVGGYHVFTVDPSSASQPSFTPLSSPSDDTTELVRVSWTTYLVSGTTSKQEDSSNSHNEHSTISPSFSMKMLLAFHILYSRILMDCTARNLGLDVPWF